MDWFKEKHKFVFIAGLPHSGTGILHDCLQGHPMISGYKETAEDGQILPPVLFTPPLPPAPQGVNFNLVHLTDDSPLVTEQNRVELFNEWKKHWDFNKTFLMERSSENLLRARFLQGLFPQSYFVIMMRHPFSISYAGGATLQTMAGFLDYWLKCHTVFNNDKSSLRNYLIIKYEGFMRDPYFWLNKIYTFLRIPYAPLRQQIQPDTGEEQPPEPGIKNFLHRRYLMMKYEEQVRTFGYSLCDLEWREEMTR